MPIPLALLVPLMLQVGPSGTQMQAPLDMPRKAPVRRITLPNLTLAAPQGRYSSCLALASTDPQSAIADAEGWRSGLTGSARAEPEQCLGLALSRQNRWIEAEQAFMAARDATAANERAAKARRGALAGNAALASGAVARALTVLDTAHSDALAAPDALLAGQIAIDRARALVLLKRDSEADEALAEARRDSPAELQAWLLSATLARRHNKLAEAQVAIERASKLDPLDAETGLEAGVIAMLAGRTEAARKSWLSVISAAPGTAIAITAQGYLDQLGPAAARSRP